MPELDSNRTRQEQDLRAIRNGSKWVRSVIAYLEWRAGLPWVNYTQCRYHPDVEVYVRAINCVNQAWNQPEPAIPKKLPQRANLPHLQQQAK